MLLNIVTKPLLFSKWNFRTTISFFPNLKDDNINYFFTKFQKVLEGVALRKYMKKWLRLHNFDDIIEAYSKPQKYLSGQWSFKSLTLENTLDIWFASRVYTKAKRKWRFSCSNQMCN